MNIKRRNQKRKSNILLNTVVPLIFAGIWIAWNGLRDIPQSNIQRLDTIGTQLGEIAPDFTILTLEGQTFNLSAHSNNPRIVFFMAYWCGTCIPEAQALARLKQEYGTNITIIAIDVDPTSTSDALNQFKAAAGGGDHIWALDLEGKIANAWRVRTLDTTLILDADGYIIYRDERPTDFRTFQKVLEEY